MSKKQTSVDNADLADLYQTFALAKLGKPPIPLDLQPMLRKQAPWTYSTRHLAFRPYHSQQYVRESFYDAPADYALVAHDGHGANSYAISFFVVHGALNLFVQAAWGGVYEDPKVTAKEVRAAMRAASGLLKAYEAGAQAGLRDADRMLFVVACTFNESWWAVVPRRQRYELYLRLKKLGFEDIPGVHRVAGRPLGLKCLWEVRDWVMQQEG